MLRLFRNLFVKSAGGRSSNSAGLGRDGYPAVEIFGLTIFRRHLPVLCDINLKVQRGETLAIMGPNGAGKTTLLKCLSGSMHFNRGKIRWSGSSNFRSQAVRRQIGYVGH